MSKTVDYYFVPNSSWSYLGHARFAAMAAANQATVHVRTADLGKVFAVSGGLQSWRGFVTFWACH